MNKNWHELGGDNIWLPYTQMKRAPEPLIAVATKGCRIQLADGRELVDGVASWWTACHGYNHPHILAAMRDQLDRMPHVMFGGINHEPALMLAKRLAALTPSDLNRVFFVDSGSVAVEAAMKIAVQYWFNHGQERRVKFLSFRRGYHGDTMGCMSLCDPELGLYEQFGQQNYMPDAIFAAIPSTDDTVQEFEKTLIENKHQLAAVVIEPLVQGVGGMMFHDAATLRRVANLCAQHNVLLIADEIFTGFGRTGTMFASEQAGIVPDILCLGKALSACSVTLAAVIARDYVFNAFWSDDSGKALMHGPTYMANPLACAAANASLDLFEREPRLQQAKDMEKIFLQQLEPCRSIKGVVNIRAKGAIGVVQFDRNLDHPALRQEFIKRATWVRSWGNHIYLTPALNINPADLTTLTSAVCEIAAMQGYAASAASPSVKDL